MPDFDTLLQRKGTSCTKWDALLRDYGQDDLMPFWVADMDFPLLPEIITALQARTSTTQSLGYTFASQEYYDSIISWYQRRHQLSLKKEEILPVPGVVTALSVIVQSLTKEGDAIVINPPVYTPFFDIITSSNRKLISSPLIDENGIYSIDFDHLESVFQAGAKMYILCSPHNPVGRVWHEDELSRIVTLCDTYNVRLVSDEIHGDIVFEGNTHIPTLHLAPNSIMISAPSKTFNIAGLKSSMIMVKNELLKQSIQKSISSLHLFPNIYALTGTTAAYNHGDAWLDALNQYLLENASITAEYFQQHLPAIKTYIPESTYLMWLDFSALGLSESECQSIMISKAKVAVNPGSEYGPGYEQFMRFNIAVPKAYLLEGLQKIVTAFKEELDLRGEQYGA